MNTSFDVIVIGVGSMGAPACFYLSKRGCRVLGLEQFDVVHEQGSHGGQSRIIRKAYFEHPDYVPLLHRAYENWKTLEAETGQQVYYKTGLLYAGLQDHQLISGVKRSAELYKIELKNVRDYRKQFPSLRFPENFEILFEPDAGFLTPEKCIRLYAELAIKCGALIHTQEKVLSWKYDNHEIKVATEKKIYTGKKLVITAGAWAGKLITSLSDKIKVTKQLLAWVKPEKDKDFLLNRFPCWMIADDKPGCFYGFPMLPVEKFGMPHGLKLAYHHPASATDPDRVNPNVAEEDINPLRYCLQNYFPGINSHTADYKTCLYANSPDEHFIIDLLPGSDNRVCIACGFSGHGFKFASVVGEILADLAMHETTPLPVSFLTYNRF